MTRPFIKTRVVFYDDPVDPSFGPFPAWNPNPANAVQARWDKAKPTARMRDCVSCALPFYSRSAANAVCLVCRSETDFDGGMC